MEVEKIMTRKDKLLYLSYKVGEEMQTALNLINEVCNLLEINTDKYKDYVLVVNPLSRHDSSEVLLGFNIKKADVTTPWIHIPFPSKEVLEKLIEKAINEAVNDVSELSVEFGRELDVLISELDD